ncbi:MAG: 2-nitropropane dioxygenase [Gemmatimonadetes bacterium]|nr:2-nitropropane dioxygenase [Gemmatimonadota bacterium]
MKNDTPLTHQAGIQLPLICGPMYPCSNPELVAAASDAGAIGVVQPLSLTYVHGHDFREGLRLIKSITDRPIGMNALIEASSKRYHNKNVEWIDIALEEGVRFFITSLGKPRWVVDRVSAVGGVVYHDITERKWALKALDSGVQGLIAVNKRAGGHAGPLAQAPLLEEVSDLGLPVVCAGGIGTPEQFVEALRLGYAGVQMGTRFIATTECRASTPYKQSILDAEEGDIVLTERLSGIPVAVINTPYVQRRGTKSGSLARWMLRGPTWMKHLMRTIYALKSTFELKRTSLDEQGTKDYWQAGCSVSGIDKILSAREVVKRCADALAAAP